MEPRLNKRVASKVVVAEWQH